jgi:hypothetical protein
VQLTGARPPPLRRRDADAADSDSGPRIEQIMPRVNGQTKLILALALGILALGFALLYRARRRQPAKETE